LYVRQGRLPSATHANEVAIIGSFADAHQLTLDDSFNAIINGRQQTLKIVGIVESPEFIYVIPPGGMLPDYQRFGVLWLNQEALAAAMDMRGAFNSLVLQIDPRHPVEDVIDPLDRLLARYGSTGAFARADQFSHRFLSDELEQLKAMAIIFPSIFMGVAMFLLNVVVTRLISTQREIVAILKAFGYSNGQIGWHYSQMVLAIALTGLAIGCASGLWLGHRLGELYMDYYRFPTLLFLINPWWLALLALISMAVALLGGWRSIRAAAALPPGRGHAAREPRQIPGYLYRTAVGLGSLSSAFTHDRQAIGPQARPNRPLGIRHCHGHGHRGGWQFSVQLCLADGAHPIRPGAEARPDRHTHRPGQSNRPVRNGAPIRCTLRGRPPGSNGRAG
jgi:putative ABC transport system permease protein